MTEAEFNAKMTENGWSEEEIQELLAVYRTFKSKPGLESLSLESFLIGKISQRVYRLNEEGHLVDD